MNGNGAAALPEFSVAMTDDFHQTLTRRQHAGRQEDLGRQTANASYGHRRMTAVMHRLLRPTSDERILQGNVAFTPEYLVRALMSLNPGKVWLSRTTISGPAGRT